MAHLLCRLCCARRHQSGVIARSSALQDRDAASKPLRCQADALSRVISTVQVHHAQVSKSHSCCPLYSCRTLLIYYDVVPWKKLHRIPYYGNFITTKNSFKPFDVSLDVLVCLCVNAQVLMQLESALCPLPMLKNGWFLMKVDGIHNGMIPAPHCLCVHLCQRCL